jgi:bifunctional NMN adenylyltransferase/nudix hydrolase
MEHAIAGCLGRFQPVHLGHVALVQRALASAQRVVVAIGSAWQARTPRNPFTWQERADMLLASLAPEQAARIHMLPIRDYYDTQRWAKALIDGVMEFRMQAKSQGHFPSHALSDVPEILLLGRFADDSVARYDCFRNWLIQPEPKFGSISGQQIRDKLFSVGSTNGLASHQSLSLQELLAEISGWVPLATLQWLERFVTSPDYQRLCIEHQDLRDYKLSWQSAPYPPVFVTCDALVQCQSRVLLIQRKSPPGQGLLALPGGFIDQRETLLQSALRELREETSIDLTDQELLHHLTDSWVFDHPDRSQRGRIITHGYHFNLGDRTPPRTQAADGAQSILWMDCRELIQREDQFHDDHFIILDRFLKLLK